MPTLNSPSLRQITTSLPAPAPLDLTGLKWLKKALRAIVTLQGWLGQEGPLQTLDFLQALATYTDDPNLDEKIPGAAVIPFLRYAPSIITRGEIEALNLAMPRFAVRAYLEPHSEGLAEGVSFVNIRRLHEVHPGAHWADRIAPDATRLRSFDDQEGENIAFQEKPTPAMIVERAVHIADSLLKFANPGNRWHILTQELGSHYGELPVCGTPFVRTYPFSGLCAQAVCFVANSLMIQHADGLFGIAEITKIAQLSQPPGTPTGDELEEVALQGLNCEQIASYFRAELVGLHAAIQVQHPIIGPTPSALHGMLQERWFSNSLRSYLRSDIPVIVPLDFNQLTASGGPYQKNDPGLPSLLAEEIFGVNFGQRKDFPAYHAVCLVGCATAAAENPADDFFLAHDPTFMPFVEITTAELIECLAPPAGSRSASPHACYLPVVPRPVKLLLDAEVADGVPRIGLRNFIDYLRWSFAVHPGSYQTLRGELPACGSNQQPGEFRLTRIDLDAQAFAEKLRSFQINEAWITAAEQWLTHRLATEALFQPLNQSHRRGLWVWLHFDGGYLYIWSAETVPNTRSDYHSILRFAVGVPRQSTQPRSPWSSELAILKPVPVVEPARFPLTENGGQELPLEASLITSYAMTGLEKSLASWPAEIRSAELYAFMQCDAERFLGPYSDLGHGRSVNAHMAAIMRRDDAHACVKAVAVALADLFRQSPASPAIRSIASFLSGLVQWERSSKRFVPNEETTASLKFLILLGEALRGLNHDVGVLELVAGSRAHGPVYGRNNDVGQDGILLNVPEETKLIRALAEALRPVARFARDHSMKLAIEMEPGPLHLVNSIDAITQVLDLADSENIGANIDIAHFAFLARKSARDVLGPLGTSGRIFHAHIAGHSIGHLGDIGLNDLKQVDEGRFNEWLDGLRWLRNQPGFGQSYSGFVSLELECVRCAEHSVQTSAARLVELLDQQERLGRLGVIGTT